MAAILRNVTFTPVSNMLVHVYVFRIQIHFHIYIYIYSICKITSLSKYKCKLPSFTCMSSLNKYFKKKKTKNLLCFGILFPKGELQKFHRPSRQIAPESLPVSGNVFCLKKNHLIFRQKKSIYINVADYCKN